MKKLLLALLLAISVTPALAQAPPPVPALPDAERRTSYTISGTTCACAVGFQIYGDGTDFQDWIEVWFNGTRVNYNDPTFGWTVTSPTGPFASIPRPIIDAVLTFNAAQTGTVQIVGARLPRRTSQFPESRGVAARDFNQVITDLVAQNRETWDKINSVTGRALLMPAGTTAPLITALSGNSGRLATLSGPATPGSCPTFDGSGNIVAGSGACVSSGSGVTAATQGQLAGYAATGSIVSGSTLLSVNPTTSTLNINAGTVNNGTTGGHAIQQPGLTATVTAADFGYNSINITQDQINSIGAPNASTFGFGINFVTGGSGTVQGQKYALRGTTVLCCGPNTTNGDIVGLSGWGISSVTNGGTNTGAGAKGTLYGVEAIGHAFSGAINYAVASGGEVDAIIDSGASAKHRWDWSLVSNTINQGVVSDAAVEVASVTATSWRTALLLDNFHGFPALSTNGCVICTDGSANTISEGMDLSSYTISNFFLKSINFIVNGSGDVNLRHLSGQISIGSPPTASSCAGFALATASGDTAGKVSFTSATSCAITFGTNYVNPPFCVVAPGSATSTVGVATTASTLTATFGTAQTSMNYQCMGS